MRKFKETWEMLRWVLAFCVIFIVWAVIAKFGTVLLVVLYPLYLAIVLGGLVIIKYQYRDIETLSSEVLRKEVILRLVVIGFIALIYGVVKIQVKISFEYDLILIFFLAMVGVDAIVKNKHI